MKNDKEGKSRREKTNKEEQNISLYNKEKINMVIFIHFIGANSLDWFHFLQ